MKSLELKKVINPFRRIVNFNVTNFIYYNILLSFFCKNIKMCFLSLIIWLVSLIMYVKQVAYLFFNIYLVNFDYIAYKKFNDQLSINSALRHNI